VTDLSAGDVQPQCGCYCLVALACTVGKTTALCLSTDDQDPGKTHIHVSVVWCGTGK